MPSFYLLSFMEVVLKNCSLMLFFPTFSLLKYSQTSNYKARNLESKSHMIQMIPRWMQEKVWMEVTRTSIYKFLLHKKAFKDINLFTLW